MAKEIPEIDELLQGINDADAPMEKRHEQENEHRPEAETTPPDTEKCWESFMACLESPVAHTGEARLVCKIDRDLADSLDDCDNGGRCRSDLVNAIVRAFFSTYLPLLAKYRREKKSLFDRLREDGA